MSKKIFTIFAGVNGAGKSTLYNSPILEKEKLGIRINTDEIVRTFGDWKNEVDQVKEKGYKVHLFYVGVNSPEIAKERIAGRVKKGGHDIPSETVEKRYYESIENLKIILPKVDLAEIYDNSKFYTLAITKNEEIIRLQTRELPEWLKDISKEFNKTKRS